MRGLLNLRKKALNLTTKRVCVWLSPSRKSLDVTEWDTYKVGWTLVRVCLATELPYYGYYEQRNRSVDEWVDWELENFFQINQGG